MSNYKTHITRYSDSSFYDEVCVFCGRTDYGNNLDITPCPVVYTLEDVQAIISDHKNDTLVEHGGPLLTDLTEDYVSENQILIKKLLMPRIYDVKC